MVDPVGIFWRLQTLSTIGGVWVAFWWVSRKILYLDPDFRGEEMRWEVLFLAALVSVILMCVVAVVCIVARALVLWIIFGAA